jgi:glyoxylase-like metal-dependent hydrolase (beta-lactamase superfamily II)
MASDAHSADSEPTRPAIRATVYVGRWPQVPVVEVEGIPSGTFSPTTSVLVSGPTEAVLIDAQYLKDDVRDLGDLIERTGKTLTTIYVTHAHADHYGGIGALLERFPSAKAVALPHVIESIKETLEMQTVQWALLFGDSCTELGRLPDPLEGRTMHVDGAALEIIEVKQADIHPTTIVHVPDIGLVVAGDAIYNEIHPMLGLATPDEWGDWIDTVDTIADLRPRMIVAGHRRPDGDDYATETMIAQTRSYIADFAAAHATAKDAEELVKIISAKYPHHGNLWTLQFSALSAIALRDTGSSLADVTS